MKNPFGPIARLPKDLLELRSLRKEKEQAEEALGALRGIVAGNGDDPVAIMDGLSYQLPMLLPQAFRLHLERTGQMGKFLQESAWVGFGGNYGVSYDKATDFQFDAPYKNDPPFNPPYESPLHEWDYSTRRYVLEQARGAMRRNPLAQPLKLAAYFAVGEGFQLQCHHPQVREILEAFIDHPENDLRNYEREAAVDLLVDGELLLEWSETELGELVVIPLPPHELEAIETALGHHRKARRFHFQREIVDGDHAGREYRYEKVVLDAEDVLYVPINKASWMRRGISELYPVLPWLRAYQDWLEDRARVNYYKALITYLIQVEANNAKDIAAVAALWRRPPKRGSVAIESSRVNVSTVTPNIAGEEVSNDGRQLRMQIAVGEGLPEYFLSDGQNANLATATQQQLPALVKFENYQRILLGGLWAPMFRKVLRHAVENGRLDERLQKHDGAGEPIEGEMLAAEKAFDVHYRPVLVFNELEASKALVLQVKYGLNSRRSAMARMGYNADQVMQEIEQDPWEQAQQMDFEGDDAKEVENATDSL